MRQTRLQAFFIFILSAVCGFSITHFYSPSPKGSSMESREPQGNADEIYKKLDEIEKDLDNPQVFNRKTAVEYIHNLTEAAYNLGTSEIFPNGSEERARFVNTRKDWMERLFRIQLKLRDKMHEFHTQNPLNELEVAAFRNGNMYLSYAQDFVLIEWAQSQDLKAHEKLFSSDFPVTQKNPNVKKDWLMPGDIILVRGNSFVSATIARSGDYPSNFSHVAMVVQDSAGNITVAEALMEEGLIGYSLDQYLSLERLSRAVVLRPRNAQLAKQAALEAYTMYADDLRAPKRKIFDMLMNPTHHDKIYCAELIKMAFEKARKILGLPSRTIPTFPMSFKKALAGNSFYRGMGNKMDVGFAPEDTFFEPDFDIVMTHRDISLIKKSWAFDVAMSTLFEYIANRYDYKQRWTAKMLANAVYYIKNELGFEMKSVPPGVDAKFIQLIIEHKKITMDVYNYLMKVMDYSSRPLAYKELQEKAVRYLDQNKEKYFVPCAKPSAASCEGKFR